MVLYDAKKKILMVLISMMPIGLNGINDKRLVTDELALFPIKRKDYLVLFLLEESR